MKKSISLALTILFSLLAPYFTHAKGADVEQMVVSLELRLDNGDTFELYGDGVKITTPSSNFLKTYQFKVPDEALEQINFGMYANKIIGVKIELGSGEVLIGIGFLNKAGCLNFSIHHNGSGGYFPKGWF